ncbi:hypothetical protein FBUS_00818 [Fasciolopsis buskii]|uniref:Uncharacterized protein n=1 Tax=Fasciolopsis buskii TaxID=27845 RepID=A0A8E0RT76_9TREM|nr:hypothetical protein FBUS_00818 [Fasciolopsis buski]
MELFSSKTLRNAITTKNKVNKERALTDRANYHTNVIYSGRLLIRFVGCSEHSDQLPTGIKGDQDSFRGIYDQLKPYTVVLYRDRTVHLEACSRERASQSFIRTIQDTEKMFSGHNRTHLRYRIVRVKQKNPHTFHLDVINSKTHDGIHCEKLICHVSQSKKSTEWVKLIQRVLMDSDHSTDSFDNSLSLKMSIYLTVTDRLGNLDDERKSIHSNCGSFVSEPAHLTINSREVQINVLTDTKSPIKLEVQNIQIKRKQPEHSKASNVFKIFDSTKEYTCQTTDHLQCLIASTLLELWIRLERLARPYSGSQESNGKPIEGRLLIGPTLFSLDETQVCIYSHNKYLECLDMYGTFEQFEILHSDLVYLDMPHFHACRVLARQTRPEYEAGHIRELFIRVPTRQALLKWHQHFNMSPSTVLSLLHVILTEMESRRHIPQGEVPLDQGDGIPEEQRLDLKEALVLFTLSAERLSTVLKVRVEWSNSRIEQLLLILLSSMAYPTIKSERQVDITNLMLPHGFDPNTVTDSLPNHLGEVLSQMSTFNLCILNRLVMFFIVGMYNLYPNWGKLNAVQSLCLIQKHWIPLIESLCHRKNHYLISNRHDNRSRAISYFIASYQYILHEMLMKADMK